MGGGGLRSGVLHRAAFLSVARLSALQWRLSAGFPESGFRSETEFVKCCRRTSICRQQRVCKLLAIPVRLSCIEHTFACMVRTRDELVGVLVGCQHPAPPA